MTEIATTALCATHSERAALGTCTRCGDYACRECFDSASGRCAGCLANVGVITRPDGSVVIPIRGLGERVSVKSSLAGQPKVLLDGRPVKKLKGVATIDVPGGDAVRVRTKARFIDPFPRVWVDDVEREVVAPLDILTTLWCAVPVAYGFVGGCAGMVIAVLVAQFNLRYMRSAPNKTLGYAVTGAVGVGGFFVLTVLSALVEMTRSR